MGQHEAGKHSKAGQAKAKANPRMDKKAAKVPLPQVNNPGKVYKSGFLGKLFGKDK